MTTAVSRRPGAVVLVGGAARRMGGAAKPLLELRGRSLLGRTIDALERAGVVSIVAVGPRLDDSAAVRWEREDPPFGGPVAGIAAALPHVREEWVYLLAGDLVHPDAVVDGLASRRDEEDHRGDAAAVDGRVFIADGRPQWLAGLYRTASVRTALAALATERDASMRALLGGLAIEWVLDEDGLTVDIDTPADLARARERIEERS